MPIETNITIMKYYRDHATVPDTVKVDIKTTDKTRGIVNNAGRALVQKNVLMHVSINID